MDEALRVARPGSSCDVPRHRHEVGQWRRRVQVNVVARECTSTLGNLNPQAAYVLRYIGHAVHVLYYLDELGTAYSRCLGVPLGNLTRGVRPPRGLTQVVGDCR